MRVKAYRESASAKSVEGRAEFSRMLDDLPRLRPDAIVVDTLDRFTRNLREGLELLEQLRGHGVGLLPLDWDRDRAIDVDDDRDWADVVAEFTAAERERRKIGSRVKRSWAERRADPERAHSNVTPFGLARQGKRFVPGPDAWIVQGVDERYLAGERVLAILAWAVAASPHAWKTHHALLYGLANRAYVVAGVRTAETQALLDAQRRARRGRSGASRKHDHRFAAVFACGRCKALGVDALMGGQLERDPYRRGRSVPYLVCQGGKSVIGRHPRFGVAVARVEDAWNDFVGTLTVDPATVKALVGAPAAAVAAKRRQLARAVGRLDDEEARLAGRRARALDLLADDTPAIVTQARKALADLNADEATLAARREAVAGELAQLEREVVTADEVRTSIASYRRLYARASERQKNLLNRALCAAIGSHPVLDREHHAGQQKYGTVTIAWPPVVAEPVRIPYRAAQKPTRRRRHQASGTPSVGAAKVAVGLQSTSRGAP